MLEGKLVDKVAWAGREQASCVRATILCIQFGFVFVLKSLQHCSFNVYDQNPATLLFSYNNLCQRGVKKKAIIVSTKAFG